MTLRYYFNPWAVSTRLILCICVGSVLYCVHFEVPVHNTDHGWFDMVIRQPVINNITYLKRDPEIDSENKNVDHLQPNTTSQKHPPAEMVREPPGVSGDRIKMTNVSTSRPSQKLKTVLLWSLNVKEWILQRESLKLKRCPNQPCELLRNKSQLAEADALVFNVRDADPLPLFRPPGQIYAYYTKESPVSTRERRPAFTNRFNVTMTYRLDSDVAIRRRIVPKPKPLVNSTPYQLKYPLSSRNRSVAWAVGHCDTASKREKYVESLAKYIDVDIYGKCGTHKCPRELGPYCFTTMMSSRYKFYLSFENAVCKDYVTEKLFRTLQTEMIPVVYGGTDYTRDAPEGSYINIMDFKSPKHLAEYLLALGSNETEYQKYFQWRERYMIELTEPTDGYCSLCDMLNDATFSRTHDDVDSWYFDDTCDYNAMDKLRDRAGDDW